MAEYRVQIRASALKEIDAIPSQKDRQRIVVRIRDLANAPRPQGSQKLTGQDLYRIRQGVYRIVYSIVDRDLLVEVVKVGHRKDVYR